MATPVLVLAAASLVEVLPALYGVWPASSTAKVEFSFDATSRLAKQAQSGLAADAFVSADAKWMTYLENRKLTRGKSRVLARNALVAVAPLHALPRVDGPSDLAALDRVALAGETVPAGMYAQQALNHAGVWTAVFPKIVRADSVRAALRWAAAGEADAAVVYKTDALAEPRVRIAFEFPAKSHEPIVYPAAVLASAKAPNEARAFLDFCASREARATWLRFGFGPAP